jgi:hypothetical protein
MSEFERYRDHLFSYDKLIALFASSYKKTELINKITDCLIPVIYSAEKFCQFVSGHQDYLIVPYLLYKDDPKEALLSTSSMHMNWLWPNLLYVPVNIKQEDHSELRKIYTTACNHDNVIFINHTIPHKSNPVMLEMFSKKESTSVALEILSNNSDYKEKEEEEERGDYLSRRGSSFDIAEGNGQAFVKMVKELAKDDIDFTKVTVVIIGVGGAGELAARTIHKESPHRLLLVDIKDKRQLSEKLGAEFYQGKDSKLSPFTGEKLIEILPDLTKERLVIIDATAHFEDGIQRCVALDLVEKYDATGNIFIDYNMNPKIGAYNYLKSSTGVGKEYVAITNYIMVQEIIKAAKSMSKELALITKGDFDKKVSESVQIRDKIKSLSKKPQKICKH